MMRSYIALLVLSISLFVITACAPRVELSQPQSTELVTPVAMSGMENWEERWQQSVRDAKKEGNVIILMSTGGAPREAIIEGFQKKFGIRVEAMALSGSEIAVKLLTERKANIYNVDVYLGCTRTIVGDMKPMGAIDPLEPALLLPEVIDPKVWWRGQLDWVDKERKVLAFLAYPKPAIAFNTNLVKLEEMKSWKDLLNPKWKGRIVMGDPTVAGPGMNLPGAVGRIIMGWEFLEQLAKQEPLILRDRRLEVDMLAKGKMALDIVPDETPIMEYINAGAPIKSVIPIEGTFITSGMGSLVLINKAPHPNAARVFINWLLTQEGQTYISRAAGQSGRIDVATDFLNPLAVRQPNEKYVVSYDEDFALKVGDDMKKAREIFGHLLR